MDPTHVRCKDVKPNIPDAFERLRREQSSTKPNSSVRVWLNGLLPELPHLQPAGRQPLRLIEQPNSRRSNPIRSCNQRSQRNSRACGIQKMTDNNTQSPAKRGRGRPRGTRGRGGRGRTTDDPRGVGQGFGTDGAEGAPEDVIISGEGDPFIGIPPSLVLRPTEPSSSSSRRSPTRSPTRSKTASAVVKKGQLAFMTPAIRFVSHERATERGGLPPVVEGLWRNHVFQTLNRSNCIPLGLKVSVHSLKPRHLFLAAIHCDVTDSVCHRSV